MYYLVAPTGIPNLGDELITATWLRHLAEVAPDTEVVLDCLNPTEVTAVHPRLRTTSVLWKLCMRYWAEGTRAAELVGAAVANPVSDAPGLDLLRRAEVVHLLGGGYLNEIWPAFLGLPAGIAAAARCSGGWAVMTGQGLCPPPEGAEGQLRELLDRFDVVDVRDTPSLVVAGEGATCSGDDVFLGLVAPPEPPGDVPEMMVSVQSILSKVDAPTTVELVKKTVVEWDVADVGLLECSPREDRELLELLELALPARRYSMRDVIAGGFPAGPGQCWLATRFHPHLFAAAAGASGVALNINGDYYGTKHRSLVEQGSRWPVLDHPAVTARPTFGGFPAESLQARHAAKKAVAARIYPSPTPV